MVRRGDDARQQQFGANNNNNSDATAKRQSRGHCRTIHGSGSEDLRLELRATMRFRIVGDMEPHPRGWTVCSTWVRTTIMKTVKKTTSRSCFCDYLLVRLATPLHTRTIDRLGTNCNFSLVHTWRLGRSIGRSQRNTSAKTAGTVALAMIPAATIRSVMLHDRLQLQRLLG